MKPARIAVLVIAIAAGGLAALLAGRTDNPPPVATQTAPKMDTVEVLVAKGDIALGQIVTAQDLRWQDWPPAAANANFIRRDGRATAIEELAGSIARTPFVAGEPIREAKLIKANGSGFMAAILPAGMRAISTEISPETGAGGFILPNDHVDVILTRRSPDAGRQQAGANTHSSETILTNVKVLAIDQTIEEKDGQRVVVGKTATLELSPRQSETLALSRQLGTLSLALRSLADMNGATSENEDLRQDGGHKEINLVRFGVTTMTMQK
jgi:pilus assembly protein CpaB